MQLRAMSKQEYERRKKELTDKYKKELKELESLFCMTNALPKGTIAKDHIGFVRIIEWEVYHGSSGLDIKYKCENLTQKFERQKREPYRDSYHSNIFKKE